VSGVRVVGGALVRALAVTGLLGGLWTVAILSEPDDAAGVVTAFVATVALVAGWAAWDAARAGYLRTLAVWALAALVTGCGIPASDLLLLVVPTMLGALPGAAVGAVIGVSRVGA